MSITRLLTLLFITLFSSGQSGAAEREDRSANADQGVQTAQNEPLEQGDTSQPGITRPPYQPVPQAAPYQTNGSAPYIRPAPMPAAGLAIEPRRAEPSSPQSQVPRWLEEVRAQRRALYEQRRAAHQARIDAFDPIGSAKRDERHELQRRHQEERRELIESERRLYLNRGPWLSPLAPMPPPSAEPDPLARGSLESRSQQPAQGSSPQTPSDWNNLWYYKGW
ncbi:hypothetical protein [Halochromatium roseum]|uniref:hypothetical protein n=1 Tax=Halochromatium roseum TaxID=391920 RepID=UPI001911F82E|nr:hypothetical protein [Halochromatium roseum]MBK5941457.1 hypothetical protein [Halochromatium roseum]